MAITILAQDVFEGATFTDSFTVSTFAVPGGTSSLLVGVENRGFSSGTSPPISTVTHNGDAVSVLLQNAAGGYDDINTWWGQRASPDIGTNNVVINFAADVRGCKIWLLAISGELATGSILGQSALQRNSGSANATVGLGFTPSASGDSLLLASLAIARDTTLSSFAGSGFTEVETDKYGNGDELTSTSRYRIGGTGPTTVSATFAVGDTDIGGSFIEILAEPASTDVAGSFVTTLSVTGSIAGASSAETAEGGFRNALKSWAEWFTVQPDATGVDRRLIAAGPPGAPNLTVDQVAAGSVWRWRYRLTDGQVEILSAAGSQSATAQHVGLVHSPGAPILYISGRESLSNVSGNQRVGGLDIGPGPQTIGGHGGLSPAPYTGLVGRYFSYDGAISAAQMQLMALDEEDPDSVWAYGDEDAAVDSNKSPLAFPAEVDAGGQSLYTFTPKIADPGGGSLAIASVTQPTNGTLGIGPGRSLIYRPNAGWQGVDSATYTVTDGSKTSTAKLTLTQTVVSLIANGDSISVQESGSIDFDPRANDSGAGPLTVTGVSPSAHGTTLILANGKVRYTPDALYTGSDSFTYTVTDNFSAATGTVTVTVLPEATSYVDASDDTASTSLGTAILLSPLGNDQVSGNLFPLIVAPGSVTTPSPSGTAIIQANQRDILFTPGSNFVGAASFSYTARSSVNALFQDTALVTVQVQNVVAGANFKHPPTVTNDKIMTVGYDGPAGSDRRETLVAAYDAIPAAGGWEIRLNDGTYSGNIVFDRTFTNNVIIRSRNFLKAVFPGRVFCENGHKHWLYDLDFTNPTDLNREFGVIAGCQDLIVTKCRFSSVCGVYITSYVGSTFVGARRFYIGWNDFIGQNPKGLDSRCHIKLVCMDQRPMTGVEEFNDFAIYRNYFHDPSSGNNLASVNEVFNFYIGNTKTIYPDYFCSSNGIFEYNLFASGNNRRAIYMKRGVTHCRFNHIITCKSEAITQRTGWGTNIWGNRVDDAGGGLRIGGGRMPAPYNSGSTDVRGNRVAADMLIRCGITTTGGNFHPAANNSQFVGNNVAGTTTIGFRESNTTIDNEQGGKLKNCKYYEAIGGGDTFVVSANLEIATCDIRPTFTGHGLEIPTPVTLSRSVVGLEG